ncbi:MAG: DUF2752 domain-containing protein [Bryobacteraceae bacterium]|nr:DUF2752 domain-containing protein [Bryobacteraceae bacterium]
MTTLPSPRGVPAATTAAALIVQLLLAALLLTTGRDRVYFLNHPIPETCAWKSRYGVPCPSCGWTRAVVLTLHGDPVAGWRTNPTGPLAVLGMTAAALALLFLAAYQRLGGAVPRRLRWGLAGGLVLYTFATCLIGALAWLRLIATR